MTEEQYKRAIAIHNRIEELTKIKCELTDSPYTLGYFKPDTWSRFAILPYSYAIQDLLYKYNAMIFRDIENEIDTLNEEIKNL